MDQSSPPPGRGTPGRHRGASSTLRLPWRTLGVRAAVGVALVAGAGVATLGADGRALSPGLGGAVSTASTASAAPSADAVDVSLRLVDDRASRSMEREAAEVPRMRATATSAPTLTVDAVPPPAPAEAPAPTTPPETPSPTATKATPTPSATSAAAAKTVAPAAPAAPAVAGISMAACADGSAVESGLTKDAIRVHRAVCALFPGVSGYGGLRGSGDFHGTGQAVDIMVGSSGLGSQIAAYVRANAAALGVSEVIWSQKIWTVQRSSEGWRAMPDRGSATANHYDHVHVSVYGNAGG